MALIGRHGIKKQILKVCKEFMKSYLGFMVINILRRSRLNKGPSAEAIKVQDAQLLVENSRALRLGVG